ncbi:zinc-binding dehydrogenase [uncultured Phenylobacterium sp.]|uniref:zinc-binding dehydrogenase n=1 Tax=uncultured Phenylobacterium sp. TaxID=349273 RepID=UPI0025D86EFE|nr:zinc-binding dehydrogenase [uncultured Phenylobacterium sp.]
MSNIPSSGLQLRSLITADGQLELSLDETPVAAPSGDEILVQIEAAPINPSDLGLLVGPADVSTLKAAGGKVTAKVPPQMMRAMAARVGHALPVGNEGAGTVIAAGPGAAAQAMVGKRVAMFGGATYAQYRTVNAGDVLVLPADASAADGASCFVNPLTALGFVETMRLEGHTALVHTAAASNLGQMLQKICLKDGVDLVNIVRSAEQAKILKDIGAKYVVDSTSPSFMEDLVAALTATNATLGFDAIGGGKLASQILSAMEQAQAGKGGTYNRYGSNTYKQVYIYGGLDTGPTELNRAFGFTWGLGGWLLPPFLAKVGPEASQKLRQRVIDELKTTFASHYTAEISLEEALKPDVIAAYNKKATGEKYLINPAKGH